MFLVATLVPFLLSVRLVVKHGARAGLEALIVSVARTVSLSSRRFALVTRRFGEPWLPERRLLIHVSAPERAGSEPQAA